MESFWKFIASFPYADTIFMTLLMIVGILLILIILLQRGRGGGLAGAFGGLGGQSAFGTKAGDVFTKITVVLAAIWVLLAGASIKALEYGSAKRFQGDDDGATTVEAVADPDKKADDDSDEKADDTAGDNRQPPAKGTADTDAKTDSATKNDAAKNDEETSKKPESDSGASDKGNGNSSKKE